MNGCLLLHDKNRCDSILSICQDRVANNRMKSVDLYPYQLTYKKLFGSKDDIQELLSSGENLNGLNTETMLTIVDAYRRVGDYGSALDCLDSIVASGLPYNKRKYMAVRTMLYEGEGDYRKALIYYRVNSDSLFSDHVRMQEQRLKINKEKHDAEMQVVKTKNRMDRLFFISLSGLIALTFVVFTLFFMVRGQN